MYLGCKSNLEAYPWIGNIILDDDLNLNLYVIPTICCMVMISDDKVSERTN